jgi:hypothetical protein
MALIPGYEYDIFISYAHVDNIPVGDEKEGWIVRFYETLRTVLARRFGRTDMVKIWWDSKKLDGSTVFDDSIAGGIERSAVMICLNSPGYAASDYCQQELTSFQRKGSSDGVGLKVGDRSRIINLLLNNIPHSKWPAALGGTSGFPFHDGKDPGDFGDTAEPESDIFKEQMGNLRDALWNLLNDMVAAKGATSPIAPAAAPAGATAAEDPFTIYLAEVADTLRTPRKRVSAELEKKGFRVITGVPPPDEEKAHEQATLKAVGSAQLTVHMLDEYPGREIVGASNRCYPQRQAELALQHKRPQMIWTPADLSMDSIEDPMYREFLQSVQTGKVEDKVIEFIRGSKSDVAQQIMEYATQLQQREAAQKIAAAPKVSVLVDTHAKDAQYVFELSNALAAKHIQTFITSMEEDPRKNLDILEERMREVKKLVFLYGGVSKDWLMARINVALQLILAKNYPVEDLFVYMAPPRKSAADITINQRFLKLNIVDSSDAGDGSVMRKFVTDLSSASA